MKCFKHYLIIILDARLTFALKLSWVELVSYENWATFWSYWVNRSWPWNRFKMRLADRLGPWSLQTLEFIFACLWHPLLTKNLLEYEIPIEYFFETERVFFSYSFRFGKNTLLYLKLLQVYIDNASLMLYYTTTLCKMSFWWGEIVLTHSSPHQKDILHKVVV